MEDGRIAQPPHMEEPKIVSRKNRIKEQCVSIRFQTFTSVKKLIKVNGTNTLQLKH